MEGHVPDLGHSGWTYRDYSNVRVIHPTEGPVKRGLEVTSAFAENDTVITFNPPILSMNCTPSASSDVFSQNTCWRCFSSRGPAFLQPCGVCNVAMFCANLCSGGNTWDLHRLECRALAELRTGFTGDGIPEYVLLALKIHFLMSQDDRFRVNVNLLTHHRDHFKSQGSFIWMKRFATSMATALDRTELNYFDTILSLVVVNSNIMMNAEGEAIGVAMDPDFALINHLCVPNTVVRGISNQSFALVAAEPLSPHTEITTNYCFTSFPREMRQAQLWQQFNFQCQCRLCCEKHDLFLSYNCPSCGNLWCSTLIRGALDKSTASLKFSDETPFSCSCGHQIDEAAFKRSRKLHLALFGVFYLSEFDDDLRKTALQSQSIEEIVGVIDKIDYFALSEEELVESCRLFDPRKSWGENTGLLLELCQELLVGGFIPAYCFPVNLAVPFLTEIATVRPASGIFLTPQEALSNIFLTVRQRFLVDIPIDLTRTKVSRAIHFLECTNTIMILVDSLFHPRRGRNPLQKEDQQKFANFAFKLAFFFSSQTMELFSKANKTNGTSFEELRAIKRSLEYIHSSGWLPENARTWYKEALFTDDSITEELAELFEEAAVPVILDKDGFAMVSADRKRFQLFFPFDKLRYIRA